MNIDNNIPKIIMWHRSGTLYIKAISLPDGYFVGDLSLVVETLSTRVKRDAHKYFNKNGAINKTDVRGKRYYDAPRRNMKWVYKFARRPFTLNTTYSVPLDYLTPSSSHLRMMRKYTDGYFLIRAGYRFSTEKNGYNIYAESPVKISNKDIPQ